MELRNIHSRFVFTRNPIFINEISPEGLPDLKGGTLKIESVNGSAICRFYELLDIDIAEIADAFSIPIPEPVLSGEPLIRIEDEAEIEKRKILLTTSYEGLEESVSLAFYAIPGGVSRRTFRRYATAGEDAFTGRFLYRSGNFFLTTRTSSWLITIRETELAPLYFIVDRQSSLRISGHIDEKAHVFPDLTPGIYALDIDALRRKFMETGNILPNLFDICMDGKFSCRLVIETAPLAIERYVLKFRNSLGVFELLELTGTMTVAPEYPDAENAEYNVPDYLAGGFVSERERLDCRENFEVESGFKSNKELRFLKDLLASDEVYLIGYAPEPLRVMPGIEDFNYRNVPQSPVNIRLKLSPVESDENIMDDIISIKDSRKPRIFSYHFSKEFN